MSDYVWGVLTPFICLAAVGLLAIIAIVLIWLWRTVDTALIMRVDLAENPHRVYRDDSPDSPQYSLAAKKLYDALLKSPRLYLTSGFGWYLFIVRNTKDAEK